jgi:hypothetical protein
MNQLAKRGFAFVVCLVVCAAAIWQEMQFLGTAALLACLAILFKHSAMRVASIALDLLASAKEAKLGSFEIELSKRLDDVTKRLTGQPEWVTVLLGGLTSGDIGLLLALATVDRYPLTAALAPQFRRLRERGLIQHDNTSMASSNFVWLTDLGRNVVASLITTDLTGARHAQPVTVPASTALQPTAGDE